LPPVEQHATAVGFGALGAAGCAARPRSRAIDAVVGWATARASCSVALFGPAAGEVVGALRGGVVTAGFGALVGVAAGAAVHADAMSKQAVKLARRNAGILTGDSIQQVLSMKMLVQPGGFPMRGWPAPAR